MSKIVRSIKNVANGYSSAQILVRKATANDATGPTTYDMEEIASFTYQSQTEFLEVMDMLDRRLNDKGKYWRHVAKSLTVLDYLVRYGSDKCVLWAKDNLYIVKTLREFIHLDEQGVDQGALIRVKAKELVSLLRDDERLRQERATAANKGRNGNGSDFDTDDDRRERRRPRRNTGRSRRGSEPYDADLQRALELSRITAEEEQNRQQQDETDPDLEAALKLSMEEEEMRKQKQNSNLLDLSDDTAYQQPQYYVATGYYQPQQQQYGQPQQFDMFGNPIQNAMDTGLYQQQQQQAYLQQQALLQQQQQQALLQQQQLQQPQFQANQFTGFNYGQPQQQEQVQPLKTGSNNPFALSSSRPEPASPVRTQTLNDMAQQQQPSQQQQQPQFFTQPQTASTSSSKFNETHSELNDLLAQGTGLDTFGNVGASRIPHQYTKTQNFINSSGTGYKQQTNDNQRLSSNATGNPFLNTGIGYQQPSQQQQQQQQQPQAAINAAYTGYGFGNAQTQPRRANDGPSLIDI
ncbi:Epsin-1 [Spathaspora sp. JA1]|nr:Epsin-1 [Spathaspora sp. JA1]